jgi:hypothetical protein
MSADPDDDGTSRLCLQAIPKDSPPAVKRGDDEHPTGTGIYNGEPRSITIVRRGFRSIMDNTGDCVSVGGVSIGRSRKPRQCAGLNSRLQSDHVQRAGLAHVSMNRAEVPKRTPRRFGKA